MKASADRIEKHAGDRGDRALEDDRAYAESRRLTASVSSRPFGLAAGKLLVAGDFDDPLPDDLLDLFEGRSDS